MHKLISICSVYITCLNVVTEQNIPNPIPFEMVLLKFEILQCYKLLTIANNSSSECANVYGAYSPYADGLLIVIT